MAQTLTKFLRAVPSVINTSMCQCSGTRTKSTCERPGKPRCASENLLKTLCHKKKEADRNKKPHIFKSMWENPECCIEICKDVLPRFDELYYQASDKCTREYQQTWVECPKLRIVKKPICKFEKIPTLPPLTERRCPAKDKPKTACADIPANECKPQVVATCPKITMAGCRPVRTPNTCHRVRRPTICTKVCTPYPAFSECDKEPIKEPRQVECFCLHRVPMCIVWREFHRRGLRS